MKTIHLVCAARPNFMKIAPLWHALSRESWCRPVIVHTGQHYDANMSDSFFSDFSLPAPDILLEVGSGSHAEQTGKTMIAYEREIIRERPDITIVVGDVNATVACALVCAKQCIPFAHLEAGLRSFDRQMPEEINRIVTDSIASLCLTPSSDASANLRNEGVSESRICEVGNIMIDALEMLRPAFSEIIGVKIPSSFNNRYGICTLHRPSNVDSHERLEALTQMFVRISQKVPLIFPLHPRTRKRLEDFGLLRRLLDSPMILLTSPLGYKEFMASLVRSEFVMTDSGGVQEETTYLGIPCFTLRENTERPITIFMGTNRLVSELTLEDEFERLLNQNKRTPPVIPLWDGLTAGRIVQVLATAYR
jgi:UDP-N-acetylglucosamine 2-epimerase (non-hydrolysing)